ncbi:hypothetical protein [Blastococcus xanthinilyticus]|uniref:EVE domain-containing protein n=1 Tax=Blastococcus xanthinilyticus TaxID=1564164 RepID=A0A5S5CNG7_9ACTN|nr:hypothetical protein [Blastococcus xanthinilyticus]TYP84592.1 hypothetical protein BD833_11421 [Blastococcus xanthinilyticus]
MAPGRRTPGATARLGAGDVACWVVKTSVPPAELAPGWAPGQERLVDRCLHPSYRLALMSGGQPCLLWLSGRRHPGVHAVGVLAGSPVDGPGGATAALRLALLEEPVGRGELLADPAFASAEVIRMPAGSNPSWLTAGQFAAVLARLPHPRLGRWVP